MPKRTETKYNVQAWVDVAELASVVRLLRRRFNITCVVSPSSVIKTLVTFAYRLIPEEERFHSHEQGLRYLQAVTPTRAVVPEGTMNDLFKGQLKTTEIEEAERTGLLAEVLDRLEDLDAGPTE